MQINLNIPENASADYVLQALAGALSSAAASAPSAPKTAEADSTPFGRDPFGTPYTSAADRERGENLRAWGEQFAAKAEVLELGQVDCRQFTTEDAYFFWRFGAELTAYVGPRAPENRLINALDAGSFPAQEFPNIPSVDQAQLRGGWDWTTYRGPLRAILAGHRGVTDI